MPFQFSQQKSTPYNKTIVFDILQLNGENMMHLPILERKAVLQALLHQGTFLLPIEYKAVESVEQLREELVWVIG